MKRSQLFFLLMLLSISTFSQIDVKSFRVLPNDMDARVYHPVVDQNGEKCALIKVVTTETGFAWEGGSLGITQVDKKTGEYWVYIPHGAKRITIKHDHLGVLRNYVYPVAIKEATVYEMVLTTGKVTTIVEKPEIESVWLMVNSDPSEADIYIDDTYVGQTPFQKKLKKQKYNYRLSKVKYKPEAGILDLSEVQDKKMMDISLKPNFGSLRINTEPENRAEVYIDNDNTGKTTPCTLTEIESGTHRITLRREWYEPKTEEFMLTAGEEKDLNISLIPSYGELNISTDPEADIFIDSRKKGFGSYSCRLLPGVYTIKAEKEKHHDDRQSIEITVGDVKNISLNPQPKYGTLDIASTPWDAEITIDGKSYGKTPKTIDLLIGQYKLIIKKKEFVPYSQSITINEEETKAINIELSSGKEITINSNPQGAKLYIDNVYQGETPITNKFSLGSHAITLHKEDFEEIKQVIDLKEDTDKYEFVFEKFITIESRPNNATLYINNEYKGETPYKEKLYLNTYALTIMKDGFETLREMITVNETKNFFNFSLKKRVKFTSSPLSAKLYINDRYIGFTPIETYLSTGNQKIELTKDGYDPINKTIVVNKETNNIALNMNISFSYIFNNEISESDLIEMFNWIRASGDNARELKRGLDSFNKYRVLRIDEKKNGKFVITCKNPKLKIVIDGNRELKLIDQIKTSKDNTLIVLLKDMYKCYKAFAF